MKKLLTFILLILPSVTLLVSGTPSRAQLQSDLAINRLEQDALGKLEVTWNAASGKPSFIRGQIPLPRPVGDQIDAARAAMEFVEQYANVFGVENAFTELEVLETQIDELGMTHITLQQVYDGVPIYNAVIKVHLAANREQVMAVSNGFVPGLNLSSTRLQISADHAIAIAHMALPNGEISSAPVATIYPDRTGGTPQLGYLAWLIELQDISIPANNVYVIDAVGGNIIDVIDHLYAQDKDLPAANNATTNMVAPFTLQCEPQVYYGVRHCTDDNGNSHTIIVDLTDRHVRVQTVLPVNESGEECSSVNHSGKDSNSNCSAPYPFETIASMLERYIDSGAVAIINTDYFGGDGDHGAQGLAVRNGTRLDGIEHSDDDNGGFLGSNQPSLAVSPSNIVTIGIPGTEQTIYDHLFGTYYNSVGGAPLIVEDGVAVNGNCTYPYPGDTCSNTNQSAAGVTNDGQLILITARKNAAEIASYLTTNFQINTALKFGGGSSAGLAWLDSSGQIQGFYPNGARTVAEGLLIFSTEISDPDGGRTIFPNETLYGDIESPGDIDTYYFDVEQGQTIAIHMRENPFTSSLDPNLILYTPDGSVLAQDDNSGPDDNSWIKYTDLPQTGRYYFQAVSADGSTGLYSVSLVACLVDQFYAEYYNNLALEGAPTFDRCEPAPVHYDWGNDSPGDVIEKDNFSIRWSGRFSFTEGTYNFSAITDDGLRVWVDNDLIVDAWRDQPPTSYLATRTLAEGDHEVKVEYYEKGGGAIAHLRWWPEGSDVDDGRVILSGETLWGTIEPATDVDTYYFDGEGDEVVNIWMEDSNFTPSLDPHVTVYAPDDSVVAQDDNSGSDDDAFIQKLRLTQTGRYRIEAESASGVSSGLYSLTFRILSRDRRTYDANNTTNLPGTLVRSEGQDPIGEQDADNAHDFAGNTHDYYRNTHSRYSYDDQGGTIISTVHYGVGVVNAYWNRGLKQMLYGDGMVVLDVAAHELTHAVTQHTANLEYRWQSGAMNESFSDIFAAMVDRDDWLIGEDLPSAALRGQEALRSLANPPRFRQPDHTDDWKTTCSDKEGVHTNSGILNKAYYNIATSIGKGKAERIFYRALVRYLGPTSSLEDGRAAALQAATDIYGGVSAEYTSVENGFKAVGLDGKWNPPTNNCSCAALTITSDEDLFSNSLSALKTVATLYRVRDELMSTSQAGVHYRDLYYEHTGRINALLLGNAQLRANAAQILNQVVPALSQLVDGRGSEATVSEELVAEVVTYLHHLADEARRNGDEDLAQTIEQEMVRIEWARLVGMTYTEAWEYINSQPPGQLQSIYLPIVSSR